MTGRLSAALGLLCLGLLIFVSATQAGDKRTITSKIMNLAPEQSLIRLYDNDGNIRFSHGQLKGFIPASTLKIVVALLALDRFGSDYRFTTPVYTDMNNRLLIAGQGDPLFVSEELEIMANSLVEAKITEVDAIALDDSSIKWSTAPGTGNTDNPYDAANGALIVNFNTVYLEKLANGLVRSAEPQTPLTSVAHRIGAARPSGKYRINLGSDRSLALSYAHEIIVRIFSNAGIDVHNTALVEARPDSGWQLVFAHPSSKNLADLVQLMFKYSNNFIANQIGIALSSGDEGPASLKKSVNKARLTLADSYGIGPDDIRLDEFSGISRNNFVTAEAMYFILHSFKEYAPLLNKNSTALVKSGTLDGIYHYAGYLQVRKQLWPILIITYSRHNNRDHILALMQSLAQILTNE